MKANKGLVIISIILIACCLRGPITGVGPLTSTIMSSINLNGTAAGLLTTLPLLTFAVISFITSFLSKRFGAGHIMFISLILLLAGLLIRSYAGVAGLFIGSVVIGIGIGVNNVLLPPVIKSVFPERVGQLTGLYTTLMAAFASLSTGISVPISIKIGWQNALVIWSLICILAIVFWFPNRKLRLDSIKNANNNGIGAPGLITKKQPITKSSITWFITLFMGFQSILFYCFVAWFSTILQSKGYSPETAGLLNMITLLCGLPGSFIMPIIASKTKHQSFWGAFIGLCYTIAMVSTIFAEHVVPLIITIIAYGFGSGAAIAFCMVLFNLHTYNTEDASSLSGFAQGIGYILAALGPVAIGRIIDASGNWMLPLIVLTIIGIICTVLGWLSGLNLMVETGANCDKKSNI